MLKWWKTDDSLVNFFKRLAVKWELLSDKIHSILSKDDKNMDVATAAASESREACNYVYELRISLIINVYFKFSFLEGPIHIKSMWTNSLGFLACNELSKGRGTRSPDRDTIHCTHLWVNSLTYWEVDSYKNTLVCLIPLLRICDSLMTRSGPLSLWINWLILLFRVWLFILLSSRGRLHSGVCCDFWASISRFCCLFHSFRWYLSQVEQWIGIEPLLCSL